MSTHNICFRQEIRKLLCGYPLLSVAMYGSIRISETPVFFYCFFFCFVFFLYFNCLFVFVLFFCLFVFWGFFEKKINKKIKK